MKFTCTRASFQRALTLVNHAVAKGNPEMPVLAYIRMEIEESRSRVKLQATNLEISLTVFAPIEEADEAGVIAVPAKLLTELFNTLEEGMVTFDIDLDIWKVKWTHATGGATFMGLSALEFPPIPQAEQEVGLQLFPAGFTKMIREVGVSVARDDGRQALTCILLQGGLERLTLATADGRRVSYGDVLLPAGVDATPLGNILILQRSLGELASILSNDLVVRVSLTTNRSQVLFVTPTFVFSAILLNGEFPNYRAVVPPERPLRAEVKTEDLFRIVKAARIFTGGEQCAAHFSIRPSAGFEPGSLTIVTKNEIGGNNTTIPALVRGETTEISFNINLVYEALQVISTPNTILEIGQAPAARTPALAGLLMPTPTGSGETVHVFMSMKA